ncbi:ABC transporter permease [Falsirhodobacter sp. 20TX0035]|uniref:ABC transporter permease n=1 Tax=Falsirhodobacter sp. 20TX0035 TaxID=3022019 RepID=UPI003FA57077
MRGTALAAGALALWQGAVTLTGLPPYLLPDPLRVAQALWSARAALAQAALVTGAETVIGFALGTALGVVLALACVAPVLRRAILPALTLSQTVPVFALAPILTLWFGYGLAPKIAVVVLITVFPVAAACADGLLNPAAVHMELTRSLGATQWQVLRVIRIPSARPHLATGLRIAAVYAPVGAVIGEWVGGSLGLGAMMIQANGRMKTDLVFAALFVTVALSLLFRAGIGWLADRLARQ